MKRLAAFLTVFALGLVSACGGSGKATGTATTGAVASVPAATSVAPDPNLDDATRARIHVVVTDYPGTTVDVLVDGVVAVNGGQAQTGIHAGYTTAYLYLAPGTHSVAVASTDAGSGQALVAPLDVSMAAGHRYLVAFMGQVDDHSLTPVMVDETAAATQIGATPSDSVAITLNNLTGSTGLDYEWNQKLVTGEIALGGFGAGITPAGQAHVTMTAKGPTNTVLLDEDNYVLPGDSVFGLYGRGFDSKTGWGVVDSAPTSDLNIVDYLRGFDAKNLLPASDSFPSFATLLTAIETAGLRHLYTGGATLLFLPPTDKAFAALPAAERDALLADPVALADMLRAHTVAAYVPRGGLAKTPGGAFDRAFTNLRGGTIAITGDYAVNSTAVGDYASSWVANGSQVHPVDLVSIPQS
jgi:uncharacterized surface protein with fasciclin (FAS1) repeats